MKRFLILSATLSLSILLTLVAGECVVRRIPNPYSSKHHWMLQHADSVEVLVLGSSHSYYGINPVYLEGMAYNLANISQPYKYDYYLLTRYAGSYRRLHTVIVPVSYFSFFIREFDGDEWTGNINYKIYMECPYYPDFSKYNMELSNLEVFRGKLLKKFMGEAPRNCSDSGWGTDYTLESRREEWTDDSRQTVERHTAAGRDGMEENICYFERIARFCKERGIRLVLVTTPTWSTYYDRLDTEQLAEMYEVLDRMTRRYGLAYRDYLKDSRFIADDFWDCDHLSDRGAKKFTEILQQELLD